MSEPSVGLCSLTTILFTSPTMMLPVLFTATLQRDTAVLPTSLWGTVWKSKASVPSLLYILMTLLVLSTTTKWLCIAAMPYGSGKIIIIEITQHSDITIMCVMFYELNIKWRYFYIFWHEGLYMYKWIHNSQCSLWTIELLWFIIHYWFQSMSCLRKYNNFDLITASTCIAHVFEHFVY